MVGTDGSLTFKDLPTDTLIQTMKKSYCNYIFDLYGTLVDIRTDESAKALWEQLEVIVTGTLLEFARVKRKNLLIRDLDDLVQFRLERMMAVNPNRVNYYLRYMEIIEQYNKEQDRSTIEKTFMDLLHLCQTMSEEQQRYVREGFSSDEELSIYDLLFSENLSKKDIEAIKKMSVELVKKIKERIAEMDHWTDKQETRAAVEVVIREVLWSDIPDSMFDRLEAYQRAIYEHVYTHYRNLAA